MDWVGWMYWLDGRTDGLYVLIGVLMGGMIDVWVDTLIDGSQLLLCQPGVAFPLVGSRLLHAFDYIGA